MIMRFNQSREQSKMHRRRRLRILIPIMLVGCTFVANGAATSPVQLSPSPSSVPASDDAPLAPPTIINRANITTDTDYPPDALAFHQQGTSHVRLDIDVYGKIQGCTITQSSGSKSIDDKTCYIFQKRAHFSPASSRSGKWVPGTYETFLRWQLPQE